MTRRSTSRSARVHRRPKFQFETYPRHIWHVVTTAGMAGNTRPRCMRSKLNAYFWCRGIECMPHDVAEIAATHLYRTTQRERRKHMRARQRRTGRRPGR